MSKILALVLGFVLISCATTEPKESKVNNYYAKENLVAGKTHKNEVLKLFGAPQTTSNNSNGEESWVYSYSRSDSNSTGVGVDVLAFMSSTLMGVGIDGDRSSTSSKTTSLVINFTKSGVLKDYNIETTSM